eukprot:1159245-Pelagomonas_calceolata.AAC.10
MLPKTPCGMMRQHTKHHDTRHSNLPAFLSCCNRSIQNIMRHARAIQENETMRFRVAQAHFCSELVRNGTQIPDENLCKLALNQDVFNKVRMGVSLASQLMCAHLELLCLRCISLGSAYLSRRNVLKTGV